jgi:hypothetical protein
MRWLKQFVPSLLVVAAFAVALATLLSGHENKYGTVPMPAGGAVGLPEGTVKVFYEGAPGQEGGTRLAAPLSFEVVPAGGGAPLPLEPTAKNGTSETQVQRSEDVTSLGSIAKLDVPEAGTYVVDVKSSGTISSLSFGVDPLTAVAQRWKLFAGLLGAALLLILVPMPRRHDRADDAPGWSSDSRTPYAG